MFRKLISNLPFSPTLVGELSFYAKRLKKEETTRKLGFIFITLAIALQSITYIVPTQPVNATSIGDFVVGGLGFGNDKTINNFLSAYDANTRKLRQVMTYLGITREEIAGTTFGSWKVGKTYQWSFAPRFSYDEGERTYKIKNSSGDVVKLIYARPASLTASKSDLVYGYIGKSTKLGWFALMQNCGNLVTQKLPTTPTPKTITPTPTETPTPNPAPNPTPVTPTPNPEPKVINQIDISKSAINITQSNADAESKIANPGDVIRYTLTAYNAGNQTNSYSISDQLDDILQYSNLISSTQNSSFDKTNSIISWPAESLLPGQSESKTFEIKLLDTIPTTNTGRSDPRSFDCIMTNIFGNSVNINVNCPLPKTIEANVDQLPKTGPQDNLLYSIFAFGITTYFYYRSKLMNKEIRLVKKNVTRGAL